MPIFRGERNIIITKYIEHYHYFQTSQIRRNSIFGKWLKYSNFVSISSINNLWKPDNWNALCLLCDINLAQKKLTKPNVISQETLQAWRMLKIIQGVCGDFFHHQRWWRGWRWTMFGMSGDRQYLDWSSVHSLELTRTLNRKRNWLI